MRLTGRVIAACLGAWTWCSPVLCAQAAPGAGPAAPGAVIRLGQSLPLTGPSFPVANRVLAGSRAWLEHVNAAGGIGGRLIELISLDDGGDPRRTEANVRQLARQGAIAILNCLGEAACRAAADAGGELGLPLIGPQSGDAALRDPARRRVFTLRPDDRAEAAAMARQMRTMGIQRVALLSDGHAPAREQALRAAMEAAGLQLKPLSFGSDAVQRQSVLAAAGREQALLLTVDPAAIEALSAMPASALTSLPTYIWTMSTASQTQVTRIFRDHVIGFTAVVPNPEISQLPLVRELQRDADDWVGPEALSFEGLAAYIGLRVCTDALRRLAAAGTPPSPGSLVSALESLGSSQIGGWPLRLGPDQHEGSGAVEVGLRGRDGLLRR